MGNCVLCCNGLVYLCKQFIKRLKILLGYTEKKSGSLHVNNVLPENFPDLTRSTVNQNTTRNIVNLQSSTEQQRKLLTLSSPRKLSLDLISHFSVIDDHLNESTSDEVNFELKSFQIKKFALISFFFTSVLWEYLPYCLE